MTSTHCVPVIVIAVLVCTKAMAAPPAAHGDVTAHDGVYRIGQPRFQLADDEAGGLVFRGKQVVAQQGNRVLLGLAGGAVQVWNVVAHTDHSIELQHFSITRLSVAPGDGWAFSQDAAGEQRLWRLP